jgi:hypothetical protein
LNKVHRLLVFLASLALLVSLSGAIVGGVTAAGPTKDVAVAHFDGDVLPVDRADIRNAKPPLGPTQIGQTKTWLGLDDQRGVINLKNYVLRGVGTHVEVWVNPNLNFPNTNMLNPLTPDTTDFFTYNDCRNDGIRNVITDEQVEYLIEQFDTVMYPIESDWWGVAPKRAGNKAILAKQLGLPQSYYRGEGDNIVVLVDNVRDANFYDQDNQNSLSYIAGFYYSVFDDYFDRTVMSIDAWDWIHRTGADPLHEPSTDPCTSAPARPYLYEGVFAHEYQHLLHHYTDPDELSWVNEGLSDFTEVITGYADLSKHVDEKGFESHTQSYLGWRQVFEPNWNPIPYEAGPENGLTAWEDQGDDEVLADYGAAMYFMNYVDSQPGLGRDFFNTWMHDQGNGIEGLDSALAAVGAGTDFETLFNDNLISALVDGYIDNGASVSGGTAAQFQNAAAEATILLDEQASASEGAPPWGADYIDLGPGSGLTSIELDGDDVFNFPSGPEWVVDGDWFTNPDEGGDEPDNYGDEKDYSIVYPVTGVDGDVLTFDHYYDLEEFWDFGIVQASTDDGATWVSLACTGTTSTHDSAAMPSIVANLPGYTGTAGTAGAPLSASCPALPAGTDYIGFRLMTDWATNADGWFVKNIKLDGVDVGTPGSLAGWDNLHHLDPLELAFGFALVGLDGSADVDAFGDFDEAGTYGVHVIRPTVGAGNTYEASAGDLAALSGFDTVVALVWGIPGDETSDEYQPYSLMVDGVEMADGG